jgi:hypothetical protein
MGIDAKSLIAIQTSKLGGLMAVGSCPNKKINDIFATLEEADAGAAGLDKARCFGKFNFEIGKKARIHTTSQKLYLLACWNCSILVEVERKINGQYMHDRLRVERDPTGHGSNTVSSARIILVIAI